MSVKFANQNDNIIIEDVEEETGEVSKEDENRFSLLCDNVHNCMVLIQNSHSELLEFQSILLKENIASSVLVKLSLINGKIFRSISDLHNPLGELVRLVKVYAEPWEKKSKALRKLHKDYEKKAGQLNIALKRLARQNEEAKRITRKETIQNWEQLFTRIQIDRSHGRRWKYRMFEFKLKAAQGIDNLQDYFQQLIDEDDGVKDDIRQVTREPSDLESKAKSQIIESSKSIFENISLKDLEEEKFSDDEEYQESIEDKEEIESIEPIETVDASIGTSDANFSQTLVMRIYNPKGFETFENLRCRITYGDKLYETGDLDKSHETEEAELKIEREMNEALQTNLSESEKSKGGLIGRRKAKQVKLPEKSREQIRKEQAEKKLRFLARNEEVHILIPNEVTSGINKESIYQSIKLVIFVNDKTEKKIAQATIDFEEIQELDLPVYKEYVYQGDLVTPPPTANTDEKPLANLEPMTFPLYEFQDSINVDEAPVQAGQLPIGCYFSRREDQLVIHKITETQSINRLVEELTGINLDTTTKDELYKEKVDECLSPRPMSPLPSVIAKSKFDAVIAQYKEEIEVMKESYEMKIKELLEAKDKSGNVEAVRPAGAHRYKPFSADKHRKLKASGQSNQNIEKPFSSKSKDTLSTSGPDDQEEVLYSYYSPEKFDMDPLNIPDLKKSIPANFLERVSFYSQISNKHQDELASKIKSEIAKAIKEKLAELYRFHDDITEEDVNSALADMCLPAVFMPFTNSSGTIYNPRAHQYFHPIGLKNLRISQAPSIFKLPPIKNSQLSVLNLFDIGNQMQIKRVENHLSNETAIKGIWKTPAADLIQPESTRMFSGNN